MLRCCLASEVRIRGVRGVDEKVQTLMGWEQGVAELLLLLEGNVPSGKVLMDAYGRTSIPLPGTLFGTVKSFGISWPKRGSRSCVTCQLCAELLQSI